MQKNDLWFDLDSIDGTYFANHHTENLEIFEVNTSVNLELYGTLIRGHKNGRTHCMFEHIATSVTFGG